MNLGKGYYIWKLAEKEINLATLADELHAGGFGHVIIKICEASSRYNFNGTTQTDRVPPVLAALKAKGISVWGFGFVYGNNPTGEADQAIKRVNELGVDGYVVNAEGAYYNKPAQAKTYMSRIRAGIKCPIALSSFRWPQYHDKPPSVFPFREFLEYCDLAMPQVYWVGATNSAEQLVSCLAEYAKLAPGMPIVPTGAAYQENGWKPTPGQISDFFDKVKELKLTGCNFWELANSRRYALYDCVAGLQWGGVKPPVAQPDLSAILASIARLEALVQTVGNVAADAMLRAAQAEGRADLAQMTSETTRARLQAWEALIKQGPVTQ
jgi:hypothetical protein